MYINHEYLPLVARYLSMRIYIVDSQQIYIRTYTHTSFTLWFWCGSKFL